MVPLFLELFCGSGTQISVKCVMAFRICHKSTCFVDKKKRRRDRTQEATQLRLVPKKQKATQLRLVPKKRRRDRTQEATQLRLVPKK